MKLRNRKTGEIIDIKDALYASDDYPNHYTIEDDWEDYEEPKEYWFVGCCGRVFKATTDEVEYNEEHISGHKTIGNYFETKEEAEKAVEKLKAWKRLKENGFKFDRYKRNEIYNGDLVIDATDRFSCDDKDLELLFGGEE